MKLPKLGRIGTAIVLFVVLSAAGTTIAFQATGSSSPAATKAPKSKTSATVSEVSTSKTAGTVAGTSLSNCVNSFDPNCGRFYWDPAPGPNAPLTVTVTPTSASVAAGQPVSFSASADDTDAVIACDDVYYGDGVNIGNAVRLRKQYGRWVPPAKQQGHETKTYSHTYDKAGTYTIVVTFQSGDSCTENYNPYASTGHAKLTVTVN
jgi:plastocyanin